MPKLTLTVDVDDETAEWLAQTEQINEPAYLGRLLSQDMKKDKAIRSGLEEAIREIKFPITGIRGIAGLLSRGATGELSAQQKDFLLRIEKYVQKIYDELDFFHDILLMAFNHPLPYWLSFGNLQVPLKAAVSHSQSRVREKEQTLQMSIEPQLPTIAIDERRMTQVIEELLYNACKFTPDNGTIEILANIEANHIHTQIKDNGSGIDEDELPHIFEKYYRGKKAVDQKGVGMGLFMVKQIIEVHRGNIWIESEVGKGTTVHFTLPIVEREK